MLNCSLVWSVLVTFSGGRIGVFSRYCLPLRNSKCTKIRDLGKGCSGPLTIGTSVSYEIFLLSLQGVSGRNSPRGTSFEFCLLVCLCAVVEYMFALIFEMETAERSGLLKGTQWGLIHHRRSSLHRSELAGCPHPRQGHYRQGWRGGSGC